MKEIPLTRGYVALVDDEDYEQLSRFKWHAHVGTTTTAHARRNVRDGSKLTAVFMHRVILAVPQGIDVDHIDGNGLNNARANLRPATRSQNCCNKAPQRNNRTAPGLSRGKPSSMRQMGSADKGGQSPSTHRLVQHT